MRTAKALFLFLCCSLNVWGQVTETITNSKTILLPQDYSQGVPEYFIPSGTEVTIDGTSRDYTWIFTSRSSFFSNTNVPQATNFSDWSSTTLQTYRSVYPVEWFGGNYTTTGIYVGPLYLRIYSDRDGGVNRLTFIVNRHGPIGSSGYTMSQQNTAVVIPSSVVGDVDVILEQSQDGVTWTQCLPGTYNSSTVKRFFRLRAVEK